VGGKEVGNHGWGGEWVRSRVGVECRVNCCRGRGKMMVGHVVPNTVRWRRRRRRRRRKIVGCWWRMV